MRVAKSLELGLGNLIICRHVILYLWFPWIFVLKLHGIHRFSPKTASFWKGQTLAPLVMVNVNVMGFFQWWAKSRELTSLLVFSKARSSESRGWLLYVVPICAAGRLLMIPAIWREKVFALFSCRYLLGCTRNLPSILRLDKDNMRHNRECW